MADELTAEEIAKAKELEQSSQTEKTQLDQIGDNVSEVVNMIKSQTGTEEKPDDEDPPAINLELTSEEMAKSIQESDNPKKMISELMDHCNVGIQDIVDESGESYFDDEMIKSMEESDQETMKILNGLRIASETQNERYQKAFEVLMNTTVSMAKSVQELTTEMVEMKKSMVLQPKVEIEAKKEDGEDEELPPTGDESAADPLSKSTDDNIGDPGIHHSKEQMTDSLYKSFNEYNPTKYFDYEEKLKRFPTADTFLLALQKSHVPQEQEDARKILLNLR